ncbi:hypothetical protein TNCV_4861041 [Trichonephila clavipes]|nr:hypothetical protein TNCV_4861041 [Trichonephila clavipes]
MSPSRRIPQSPQSVHRGNRSLKSLGKLFSNSQPEKVRLQGPFQYTVRVPLCRKETPQVRCLMKSRTINGHSPLITEVFFGEKKIVTLFS